MKTEVSDEFPSPSGQHFAYATSTTGAAGDLTQACVESVAGIGSGLVAFEVARVPLDFLWTDDDTLTIRYPDDVPAPRIDGTNQSFGLGGRGKVTYEAVPRDTIEPLTWEAEGTAEVVSEEALERGHLVGLETEAGTTYVYSYYDVDEKDSSYAAFEARGLQGGGYTWSGIVHGLVAIHMPHLASKLEPIPEGDGLNIESKSRDALLKVAGLIAHAKSDPELLDAAIKRATDDGEME